MMYCANCGKTFNEKMKFCIICGGELTEAAEATEATEVAKAAEISETPAEITETAPILPYYVPESVPDTTETTVETFEDIKQDDLHNTPAKTKSGKPKLTFGRIVAGVLSALIGVLCFGLLTGAGVSYTARYLTYDETVEGIVESIDILSIPIGGSPVWVGEKRDATVADAVYTFAGGLGVTPGDIAALYEETTFREDLAAVISGYLGYIRTGGMPSDITAAYVQEIYDKNVSRINAALEEIGAKPLSELDIALARAEIAKTDEMLRAFSVRRLERELPAIGILRMIISFPVIIVEIVLSALLVVAVGAITKNLRTPLITGGIAAITAGFLFCAVFFLLQNGAVPITPEIIKVLTTNAVRTISERMYLIGGSCALLGIIMVIVSRAFKAGNKRITANN
jgi:hypothetical protein